MSRPLAGLAARLRLRLPRRLPLQAGDLRGLSRLGVDAVLGVTDLVEALHHTIATLSGPLGPAPVGRPGGLTGFVYRGVRGTTRLAGRGLEALLPSAGHEDAPSSPEREAFVAALNGVWGDHLAATGNPLAIRMSLRQGGRRFEPSAGAPGGRLLLLIHGLAMNDLQWTRRGHDHGRTLAAELGMTPLYLHYNSGLHVSQNGRELSALLQRLVEDWPVPVQQLSIIGHSMGGLVARSACHVGAGQPWRSALRHLVCLGTPHHGAPLERGGRRLEALLGVSPYASPFARLGRTRSAGITDLRFGLVQDADWQGRDRHATAHDSRLPTPLPAGVACCVVAAALAASARSARAALLGDGLVPLASALGDHADPALALGVPAARRLVVTGTDHWGLLDSPEVLVQLRSWLAGPRRRGGVRR